MLNKFYVYKHTNKINNKVYIGITSQKPEERWSNGNGYLRCTRFHNSIKKYGWSNFKHEILFSNLTKEEAFQKEKELILEYNSTDERFGYNLKEGGNLPSITKCDSVNCYDLNGKFIKTFKSKSQAARELNLDRNCIIQCCLLNKKHKKVGDYIFRNFNGDTSDINCTVKKEYKKKVFIYENDSLIKEFSSIKSAASFLKCSTSSIFDADKLNRLYKGKKIIIA